LKNALNKKEMKVYSACSTGAICQYGSLDAINITIYKCSNYLNLTKNENWENNFQKHEKCFK